MNHLLEITQKYIEQNRGDLIQELWSQNRVTQITKEDFFEFADSFSIKEKELIHGSININGTGGSPCFLPNLSSLTALYASQISGKNFVKTGSGANTGIHGSSDFFREIGIMNVHSRSILDEFHFLYFDYLRLSPWKQYKVYMVQNEFLKKIFEEVFFLDYSSKDYFVGINDLTWYDKFTGKMELYNCPEHLYVYYTEKDGKIYDEIYEGTIYLNGRKYFELKKFNPQDVITASNIRKVNRTLIEGTEDSVWKQYLGYTVAMVLHHINTVDSLDEGLELFEKYYREKRLGAVLEAISKGHDM